VLPEQVDHINRNKKDNRIENLREITHTNNSYNTPKSRNSTSKYKGVCLDGKKWRAYICIKYRVIFLGFYTCETQASFVRDLEVIRRGYCGIMVLNHPDLLAVYRSLLLRIGGENSSLIPHLFTAKYLSEVL
jgi:hypothetical protein